MVLLGGPGAGKGTQSQLLCARLGVPHISTGDVLREARHAGSRLGRIASQHIDKGELVPDNVILGVVDERLMAAGANTGFVLDGFPRTIAQAEGLGTILARQGEVLTGVLYYEVAEDVLVERLAGRRVCDGCGRIYHFDEPPAEGVGCEACGGSLKQRDDDNPTTIRRRFKLYRECTQPLVDYYRQRRILHTVDATGQVEDVYLRSLRTLGITP